MHHSKIISNDKGQKIYASQARSEKKMTELVNENILGAIRVLCNAFRRSKICYA